MDLKIIHGKGVGNKTERNDWKIKISTVNYLEKFIKEYLMKQKKISTVITQWLKISQIDHYVIFFSEFFKLSNHKFIFNRIGISVFILPKGILKS